MKSLRLCFLHSFFWAIFNLALRLASKRGNIPLASPFLPPSLNQLPRLSLYQNFSITTIRQGSAPHHHQFDPGSKHSDHERGTTTSRWPDIGLDSAPRLPDKPANAHCNHTSKQSSFEFHPTICISLHDAEQFLATSEA